MNPERLQEFTEAAEYFIDCEGISEAVTQLAEICRNRGNIEREDDGDLKAARRWTHAGAVLFNAAGDIQDPRD